MSAQHQSKLVVLSLLVPIIALIAANAEVVSYLLLKWLSFDSSPYNHGLLLLVVVLYYLWKNTNFRLVASISWLGLIACIGFIVLMFAAGIIHVISVQIVALYLFIWCLIFTLFGLQAVKESFWPLVLLLFALPLWDFVGDFLQKLTLEVSYFMVYASGIPVLKEGFQVVIPPGRFEVEPGCSGLSYFMAAVSLAIIYAMMNYKTKRHYFIVIASIVFASIVANWVRVYIVIMAGYFTDMQHSLVHDHFTLGWILFGGCFVGLLYIFNKKLDVDNDELKTSHVSFSPNNVTSGLISPSILLLIIGSMFGYQYYVTNQQVKYTPDLLVSSDAQSVKNGFDIALGQEYIGAEEQYFQAIIEGEKIVIYEAYYASQAQGEELVQGRNVLYNDETWRVVSDNILALGKGQIGELKLTSRSFNKQVTLFYWYFIDGKRTTSGKRAKIYELQSFLNGNKSATAYVVLATNKNAANKWLEYIRSGLFE